MSERAVEDYKIANNAHSKDVDVTAPSEGKDKESEIEAMESDTKVAGWREEDAESKDEEASEVVKPDQRRLMSQLEMKHMWISVGSQLDPVILLESTYLQKRIQSKKMA